MNNSKLIEIWITWLILRALSLVAPVLVTYGITVPDQHQTAALLGGAIFGIFHTWWSMYQTKRVLNTPPPEPPVAPPSIRNSVLPLLFIAGLSTLFVSCAGLTPTFSALPASATPAEKKAALIQDARAKLSDPSVQSGARNALAFAGTVALQKAVETSDRTEIKNQLYSWATAFETLATGKVVTAKEIDTAAHSFNTDFSVSKYSDFLNAANGVWQLFYPQLKLAGDAELTRQWLLVLSGAARDAAGGA